MSNALERDLLVPTRATFSRAYRLESTGFRLARAQADNAAIRNANFLFDDLGFCQAKRWKRLFALSMIIGLLGSTASSLERVCSMAAPTSGTVIWRLSFAVDERCFERASRLEE